jgi:hypothetical protein
LEEEAAALRRRLHEMRALVRTMLAPVSGYLQVLARRHRSLLTYAPLDVIAERVLPQIEALVGAVDRLARPDAGHSGRTNE